MTLRELLEETEVLGVAGSMDIAVEGLGYDSRTIRPGEVFFALAGRHADGRRFVEQALAAGAAAAVVGASVGAPAGAPAAGGSGSGSGSGSESRSGSGHGLVGGASARGAAATIVEVAEPRRALAEAAAVWHGHPSRALAVVGVTGTNGKTTTTWLLESIFRAAGRASGVIGTTGYRLGDETRGAPFTTPEAPELQGLLREMAGRGIATVAIEVSSHALAQRRAYGVAFDAVVFTNLSQDHLDYHGSMDAYLDAKLMLFDGRNGPATKPTTAVVNVDDPAAARVIEAAARGGLRVLRYGAGPGAAGGSLAVRIDQVAPTPAGLDLALATPERVHRLTLPMLGRYNAANAAAAFAAARALEIGEEAVVRGLAAARGVPGRLERVAGAAPFDVVVDYAHTPDALERALAACREHARGRLLLVFGCGGDRDRAKRPLMGRIAGESSDRAWVTNDNPRSEDPRAIADQIAAGSRRPLTVELDRRAAIAAAIAEARPGDLVLIAGKGHETTQTIGGRVLPFDDRRVAAELLAAGKSRA